jgi:hypothetical protein
MVGQRKSDAEGHTLLKRISWIKRKNISGFAVDVYQTSPDLHVGKREDA